MRTMKPVLAMQARYRMALVCSAYAADARRRRLAPSSQARNQNLHARLRSGNAQQ